MAHSTSHWLRSNNSETLNSKPYPQDGPLYEPWVAILSIDGPAVIDFWRSVADSRAASKDVAQAGGGVSNAPSPAASVVCMPRSLLVFSDEAYTDYFHGISESASNTLGPQTINLEALSSLGSGEEVERGERRLSFTVRRVKGVKDPDDRLMTQV